MARSRPIGSPAGARRCCSNGARPGHPVSSPAIPAACRQHVGPEHRPPGHVRHLVVQGSRRWSRPGSGGGSLIYANVLSEGESGSKSGTALPERGQSTTTTSTPTTAGRGMLGPPFPALRLRQEVACATPQRPAHDEAPEPRRLLRLPWPGRRDQVLHSAQTTSTPIPRQTCRLCGQCDIGCNNGSKNTPDLTFSRRPRSASTSTCAPVARCEDSSRRRAVATWCASCDTRAP